MERSSPSRESSTTIGSHLPPAARMMPRIAGASEYSISRPSPYISSFAVTAFDELLLPLHQRPAKRSRSVDFGAIQKNAARIDRRPSVLRAPSSKRVEILQRETERIHARVATRARGVRAMPLEHLANGCGLHGLLLLQGGIRHPAVEAARGRREDSRTAISPESSATCDGDTRSPPGRSPCRASPLR